MKLQILKLPLVLLAFASCQSPTQFAPLYNQNVLVGLNRFQAHSTDSVLDSTAKEINTLFFNAVDRNQDQIITIDEIPTAEFPDMNNELRQAYLKFDTDKNMQISLTEVMQKGVSPAYLRFISRESWQRIPKSNANQMTLKEFLDYSKPAPPSNMPGEIPGEMPGPIVPENLSRPKISWPLPPLGFGAIVPPEVTPNDPNWEPRAILEFKNMDQDQNKIVAYSEFETEEVNKVLHWAKLKYLPDNSSPLYP